MIEFLSKPLSSAYNKAVFSCGNTVLDNYIQKQVNQDIKRKLSACFVIAEESTNSIKGYYTLSSNSISSTDIPNEIRRKLPKSYTSIPTTLIGRLAVDKKFQGQGTGKILFMDALKRSFYISKDIGSFAVVVEPIDESAEQFYFKYGFLKLPDSGKMFLPMKTVGLLFK